MGSAVGLHGTDGSFAESRRANVLVNVNLPTSAFCTGKLEPSSGELRQKIMVLNNSAVEHATVGCSRRYIKQQHALFRTLHRLNRGASAA